MKITEYLQGILIALSEHNSIVLMANTSVGKSLGLPAALASVKSRTFVSVPTRINALSLYTKMLEIIKELDSETTFTVGYAAEGEKKYDENTMLVYATSGHIRKKILSSFDSGISKPVMWADVLFVDEVHIGSIDNTMIIELWKKIASENLQVPRLLLASATVPEEIYLNMGIPDIVPYKIEAKNYPVEVYYHDRSFKNLKESKNLQTDIVKVCLSLIFDNVDTKKLDGNILIFLSGGQEVEKITDSLRFEISRRLLTNGVKTIFDVLPAYSKLTREELDRVEAKDVPGRRKIIVATNIVETGITLENLDIVIDSMIEKRLESTPSGGTRLSAHLISKSSADQRKGRVGRLRKGYAYRMITRIDYDALEAQRPPDIQRLPIQSTILELFSIGLDPEEILMNVGVNKRNITLAIRFLLDNGFLIKDPSESIKVTPAGEFAVDLPLGLRNSKVIFDWIHEQKPKVFNCIAIMTFIDSSGASSYFFTPRKAEDESPGEYKIRVDNHVQAYFDKFRGHSDVQTYINLWNFIVTGMSFGQQDQWEISKDLIKRIAQENSLNNKLLAETMKTIKKCAQIIKRSGYAVSLNDAIGGIAEEAFMNDLSPIMEDVYYDNIVKSNGSTFVNDYGMQYVISDSSVNKLNAKYDSRIIAIIYNEVSPKRSYVSVALNLPEKSKVQKKEKVKLISLEELNKLIS